MNKQKRNRKEIPVGATDYIAINSPTVARVMKGGRYYRRGKWFRSAMANNRGIFGLMKFMIRSIFWQIPGARTEKDIIRFREPSAVTLHAEGESERIEEVKKVEVMKSKRPLKVIKM